MAYYRSQLHDPWVCTIITTSLASENEPHGIFSSSFAYICMSTFLNHWHAKTLFDGRGFAEQQLRPLAISENVHNH